jgi:hypothetical protein
MAAKGRFSIAWLMVIVSFLAIDIALVRAAYLRKSAYGPSAGYLAIVLPMANILLLVLPRVRSDVARRWHWIGFEIVGWVVIAILGSLDQYKKKILFIPYEWFQSFHFYPDLSVPDLALVYTFFVVTHTPPQLLLAFLGGRIAAWLSRLRAAKAVGSSAENPIVWGQVPIPDQGGSPSERTERVEMATTKKPWSVGSLMKMSMYAAVNFAVFHAVGSVPHWFVISLLTVLNLLFFWFSRWNRERTNRRFWDWFELIGWGMIGLSVTFADSSCNLIIAPMNWLVDRQWIKREGAASTALFLLGASVVYGLFPLTIATLAGWMASRNGGLIVRSPVGTGKGTPANEPR